MQKVLTLILVLGIGLSSINAQGKFEQLIEELPTPNVYRTGSGAPGPNYYQQKADYKINVRLNDENQTIQGFETITYHNNAPETLTYLWLQLDQNKRNKHSESALMQTSSLGKDVNIESLHKYHSKYEGGFKISFVRGSDGKPLNYVINGTMMRLDLPKPLKSGGKFSFDIKFDYNINNRMKVGGRSGMEYFEKDSNYLYTIAQFFPRMCVYNDVEGWQHKQFLGRGEFALVFGDYDVHITVPDDHIVGATGKLQNTMEMLTPKQRLRWSKAIKSYDKPVIIATQEEAIEAEKYKSSSYKTWNFKAYNVRDFAFATSRKFIWDAMAVKQGDRTVMAMSYYPKEGNPLWEQYSTKVVAHTIKTYSKYTFDYPYPAAISVHAKSIGMEYPMICFNFGRPEEDGTYRARTKWGMIGVIIHEVGHNFFPMIVNSDERKWAWMDEGLNTYVEYLTEAEFDRDYPLDRGPAASMVDYMSGAKNGVKMAPIMSDPEGIYQLGNNAYGKVAAGLNILRETILGRDLMDFAFKTYAQRWMFKHPTPADFFRTIEDASGQDLDWFWRGWFYTTDPCDISIDYVKWKKPNLQDLDMDKAAQRILDQQLPEDIGAVRNNQQMKIPVTAVEADSTLIDFYNTHDKYGISNQDRLDANAFLGMLEEDDEVVLDPRFNYYELRFSNLGGLVMPVILEMKFVDGSKQRLTIPVEVWQRNTDSFSKVFMTKKEVQSFHVDPNLETADINMYNNDWPRAIRQTRFNLFKESKEKEMNQMQRFAVPESIINK